jgi:HAD superfamily phosphoserine phosphatase-like hydrolase
MAKRRERGMTDKQTLHLFDLDRTITRLPTYTPFLIHAALRLAPWRLLLIPALIPYFAGYGLKWIDRKKLKQVMHAMMLGCRVDAAKLAGVTASFAKATVEGNSYAEARRVISAANVANERVAIATASHRFYVEPIAAALGVTYVIATGSVWDADQLTPEIPGENCYGVAKLRMVEKWFVNIDLDRGSVHVRFYSDHVSDLPTFEWADEPIAIHPSPKLRSVAVQRGWPILDW